MYNQHAANEYDEPSGSQYSSDGQGSDDWLEHDTEQSDADYSPSVAEHTQDVDNDDDCDDDEDHQQALSQGAVGQDQPHSTDEGSSSHGDSNAPNGSLLPEGPTTPPQPARIKQESQPLPTQPADLLVCCEEARPNQQASQPDLLSRAAACRHSRPDLECMPGRKRLRRQVLPDTGKSQTCCQRTLQAIQQDTGVCCLLPQAFNLQ